MSQLDEHHHGDAGGSARIDDAHDDCAGAGRCASERASRAESGLSRRTVLRGVGAATVGVATVGVLAACGSTTTPAPGGASTAALPDGVLAKVADIPVGGAISVTASDGTSIILSQPTAGKIVALSAVCTHQGCTVAPDGADLVCPCHGSVFAAADGANVSGPASRPLPTVAVTVADGEVLAG